MPMLDGAGRPSAAASRPAARSPTRTSPNSPTAPQCSPSGSGTDAFANRCASCSTTRPGPTSASITRPLDAPTSTATYVDPSTRRLPEEGCGDAGVHRDVQAGGVGEVAADEREHG